MNNRLDLLVTLFAELMRLFIIRQYLDSFLEKKKKSIIPYILSFLITSVSYFAFHNLFINLAATFIGVMIITMNYQADAIKRALLSTFILLTSSIIDMIAVFLLRHNPTGNNYDIMSSFLSVGLFLVSALVVKTRNHHKNVSFYSKKSAVLLVISVLIIISLYFISVDSIVTSSTVIILGIVLFIIDIVIISLYDDILEKYVTEQENNALREQMKIYENQQRINIVNEKRIRGIKHDMKHHCIEIADLAKKGKNQEILNYVGELTDYINDTSVVQTGVESIDGIVNFKIGEAIQRGIPIDTHIAIPDDLTISSFDMNIILGNLMDNAIEASEQVDDPSIKIEITYKVNCLFIKLINICRLNQKDEIIAHTSKRDKVNHGYGLDNVRKAVEKYHGNMSPIFKDNLFIMEIILFLK